MDVHERAGREAIDARERGRLPARAAGARLSVQLLVVEDDENVAGALVAVLSRHGFDVTRARDGHSALASLSADTDLVLLDLGLPDMDGFEVCQRIRRMTDTPVIMVTARSEVAARVRGLELGADDYVTKPYDLREVLARIQTVLRRGPLHEVDDDEPDPLELGGLRICLAAREVRLADGTVVALTRKEFDLLALLVRHRGAVVPRERILHEVWDSGWKGLERTLEVHVGSLRRKLGGHDVIETVRGVGYRLNVSEGG